MGVKRPALGGGVSAFELEGRGGPLRRVGIVGEADGAAVRCSEAQHAHILIAVLVAGSAVSCFTGFRFGFGGKWGNLENGNAGKDGKVWKGGKGEMLEKVGKLCLNLE